MNRSNTGKHFKTVNQKQSLHPIIFYYFLHFFCTKSMIELLIWSITTSSVIYTVHCTVNTVCTYGYFKMAIRSSGCTVGRVWESNAAPLWTGYTKPCVLDLKMGTRMYGDFATEKKRRSQVRLFASHCRLLYV